MSSKYLMRALWMLALVACASHSRSDEKTPVSGQDASITHDASVAPPDAAPPDGHDGAVSSGDGDHVASDAGEHDAGDIGKPSSQCEVRDNGRPDWFALHNAELLGARVLADGQVEFSLFAPAANNVALTLGSESHALIKGTDGVWSLTLKLEHAQGQEYRFTVDGRSVADPYARANDGNRGNSIIVGDSDFAWTDGAFVRKPREQLVIYEAHPADFTRDPSSGVSEDKRGKFSGFAEKIAHLTRLGVTAVELMPVVENQSEGYDWGYSASLFFAPDTWLAGERKGAQVDELKRLVNALHAAGIAVIVDVVYNHVYGQTGVNHYWGVDPVYYFDVNDDGNPEDDKTDWGYKLATPHAAVRKLMYDNMRFLMSEYHVDGFRLDSTSNMNIDALGEVLRELDDDGYCDRTFIAEEFDGAHNQRIRELNKQVGRALLSSWGTGYKNRVWDAIRWPSTSMTDLTNVTYFSYGDGWNRSNEVINYISSHDEGNISAWLSASKNQVKVAATHLLTAAGIPMLWLGDEFMRMHFGNHGQNATAPENNIVDWTLAEKNSDLIDYYGALIRLRTAHASLYAEQVGALSANFVWDNESKERALGYVRKAPGDHAFFMLVNYQDHDQDYQVAFPEPGTWHLMADGRSAVSEPPGLSTLQVSGGNTSVHVPASSAFVFMRGD